MNDRVRVYELARQMNLPNQDLITALRELGYDIKSHSSTIDKHAVGLLIAALGKRKQKNDSKPAKSVKAPVTKVAPPPEPVVVKPRVLSRRKPTPPPDAIVAEPTAEFAPAAPQEAPVPVKPEAPEAKIAPRVLRRIEKPGEQEVKVEPPEETVEKEPEAKPGEPAEPPQAEPPAKGASAGELAGQLQEQMMRPPTPSVPIRIAAPSMRATPPRPPKHRHPPSERHIQQKKEEKSRPAAVAVEVPKVIALTGALTVKELAEKMSQPETEIIKRLFMKGVMRTVNQLVELELARELASEMEYEVVSEEPEAVVVPELAEREEEGTLVTRPPVVTIMGHVDHGKTSLLDAIRQTKFLLTDAEAGGITQHIGAYHVEVPGEDGNLRQIVFLDTPGHEAFTAMRARGAKTADVAVLVVAADDGVMPQTVEAIDHAKAAGVPIIVAVNKIDKAEADPDRVLTQLMEHGLVPDKYGGETVTVNVSAKKRTGLDELLEMILLVADIQDLKANPDRPASGFIIEAELSRGRGPVATALIQSGTLREGDTIVAGATCGRVRALFDDRGQRVKAAGPSMPVEVLGLEEVPAAGDRFEVTEDMQLAKVIAEQRRIAERARASHRVTLESWHELKEQGEVRDLNVIIKADVQGTAEAISDQVQKLTSREVQVRVLRAATGNISENDVNLAASSDAIVIGFNVEPDQNATRVAETAGIDIRTYNIIYQITDELEKAIQGLIQPLRQEVETGQAEIRQIFKVGKNLTIGGCYVLQGKIQRGSLTRIERNGQFVFEGKLETLKRFKDDVKEVAAGFECGMGFGQFNDLVVGDIVHAYVIQETRRAPTR